MPDTENNASFDKDSLLNTIIVAGTLCVVCSLLVSSAAVILKPLQEANKKLDIQRNVIAAGKLSENPKPSKDEVTEIFGRIEKRLLNIDTGEILSDEQVTELGIDLEKYDPKKVVKSKEESRVTEIGKVPHSPGVALREKYNFVYLVRSTEGSDVEQYIFPFYGKGLWSTMYGFVAVKNDLNTINGLTFYEHGETPGLGGEVDAAWWKNQWPGKKVFADDAVGDDSKIRVGVAKGSPVGDAVDFEVDGMSGATITSKGVSEALKYWFSEDGYGKFIDKQLKEKSTASLQKGSASPQVNSVAAKEQTNG